MSNQPKWTAKKYMGDDSYSWAVVDSRYLPKGHRGVIFEYLPDEAIMYTGLTRDSARSYARQANPVKKKKCRKFCWQPCCWTNHPDNLKK